MFVHYKSPKCFGERKYKLWGCGELGSIPECKDAVLPKNEELKGINQDKIVIFLVSNSTHEGHENLRIFFTVVLACLV